MKATYDQETDTLVLILREGDVAESDELRPDVIVDYDSEGRMISLELLDASKQLPEPAAISYEVRGALSGKSVGRG